MGCIKYKGEAYFDDLSDEPRLPEQLERIVFAFDGEALELDLDDDNAAMFRQVMAPFVRAARRTSKAAVLATLPKRRRHLTSVPSPVVDDSVPEPEEAPQNTPFPSEGNDTEALPEPEGTEVPEPLPKPLDSGPGSQIQNGNLVLTTKRQDVDSPVPDEPVRPALSIVPDATKRAWDQWGAFAPEQRDDKPDRMLKARQWAGAMLVELPDGKVTPTILNAWEEFYRDRRWARLS